MTTFEEIHDFRTFWLGFNCNSRWQKKLSILPPDKDFRVLIFGLDPSIVRGKTAQHFHWDLAPEKTIARQA